jgi:hypothetical protein
MKIGSALCRIAGSRDSALCSIARSRNSALCELNFRCRNRISDVEIETDIEIENSGNGNIEISMKFCRNFDFVASKRSKSKQRNFDKIRIKFRRI